jgi:hypothetical protein
MQIVLTKKTGFETDAPAVAVYNDDFSPFYVKARTGSKLQFNLPPGAYFCEQNIKQLQKPVNYKMPALPKPERKVQLPQTPIQIIFRPNPNKCSIFLNLGLIVCDPSIQIKSRAEKMFVIYHELGHYMYKTEKFCDMYATQRMIEDGFNPSQCVFSVNGCLSEASKERKENILNFSKKIKR